MVIDDFKDPLRLVLVIAKVGRTDPCALLRLGTINIHSSAHEVQNSEKVERMALG